MSIHQEQTGERKATLSSQAAHPFITVIARVGFALPGNHNLFLQS